MSAPRILHCWEDGPCSDDDVGTTCMLEAGHDGPHEWTRDDGIGVVFPEPSEERLQPFRDALARDEDEEPQP